MENVVYFLGAGFSAPLGIPLIKDFLRKSKDMFSSNKKKYKNFQIVFDKFNDLSVIKNYLKSDLFNIEEILSILEMGDFIDDLSQKSGTDYLQLFKQFIIDVIKFYTPEVKAIIQVKQKGIDKGNWFKYLFNPEKLWIGYGYLICSFFNLLISKDNLKIKCGYNKINTKYSIITLNYDKIIESVIDLVDREYLSNFAENYIEINYSSFIKKNRLYSLPIVKLHGSVDTSEIILPTWNKGKNITVQENWKSAFKLLSNANHIRIIGYSLPDTDTYVRYLLKYSIS